MSELNKKIELEICTDTAIDYSTCYAQHSIRLFNCDNLQLMAKMEDESVDVILTDPPYLYLKNQKLEREFEEELFFKECERLLTKGGFLMFFGRGVSFYRWNTICDRLGLVFKEEIIWNKVRGSSPVLPLQRTHETVAVYSKGDGKVNRVKVPYLEIKKHELKSMHADFKRLLSATNNPEQLQEIKEYFKTGIRKDFKELRSYKSFNATHGSNRLGKQHVATAKSIRDGMSEKSIIRLNREHYGHIHPTQKPVRLLERLLALVIPDKPKNEIMVADFFGGSFSTMEAVYNMQMKGISCEIDKEYFEAGKERIESLPPRQTSLFD